MSHIVVVTDSALLSTIPLFPYFLSSIVVRIVLSCLGELLRGGLLNVLNEPYVSVMHKYGG